MRGVLDGIKVIECTSHSYQGGITGMMLAELGADVVHIEEPGKGDPLRNVQYLSGIRCILPNGSNPLFELGNRSKRSMTLDLKAENGRLVMSRLIGNSDVFLSALRPDAAKKLNLDYSTLCAYNRDLIYAHSSGFGSEGPDSLRPVYDYLGQARSGFMSMVAEPPEYYNVAIGDQAGGIMLAYGVLAALLARERHGTGQEVYASQLGSLVFLQAEGIGFHLMVGQQRPGSSQANVPAPLWRHYRCKDGKWIALAIMESDRYWGDLCRALGIDHLENHPDFNTDKGRRENRKALRSILEQTFATRASEEWIDRLNSYDFPFSRVNEYRDVISDPQVMANDYVIEFDHPAMGRMRTIGYPIRLAKTPLAIRGPAPEFGQHTEEILLENGYTWADVAELKDQGVI